jgi:hypothetical protein
MASEQAVQQSAKTRWDIVESVAKVLSLAAIPIRAAMPRPSGEGQTFQN